ncbi:RNA-directed DNA polymerase from mobile element jockey-like [Plakobranchus ocellatus]|uniref:RNA-directed DNA polymerase from mobile element jockey-like n=1 Tax=Plakobranchus ocellatus TaxID=259542 RepID=A0AAV4CVM4_9GAST|nr:RNA-directed DNA polymerase from mobile element jockey-like [Plakobranchus ocellatus]
MGLSLNVEKTECMIISKKSSNPKCIVVSKCEQIKQVTKFKHLGYLITSDGRCTSEISKRIVMAEVSVQKMKPILTNRNKYDNQNKAMYTHSQQYWGFARFLTDQLRSPHDQVTEGLLIALQLYLKTLKNFYSCFSHKCTEYASAGLFPVVLDALEKRTAPVQAVASADDDA